MRLFSMPQPPRLPVGRAGDGANVLSLLRDGIALHRQGQLGAAAASYGRALAMAPANPQPAHLLGLVEYQRGNLAVARQMLARALAAQPGNPDFLTDMALVQMALGKADEAEMSLTAAIAARPGDVRALNLLATLFVQLARYEEAANRFRDALQHDPDNASLHSNLGSALTALGEKQAAIAELRTAIALDPKSVDAHSNLGYALHEVGENKEAVAECRQALQLAPGSIGPLFNLGIALLGDTQYAEAATVLRQVVDQQPGFADAVRGLGDALVRLGLTEEGIAEYRRAVALRPKFAAAVSNLLFHQNYRADTSIEEAVAEARRYGELIAEPPERMVRHANIPDPERRLKIGLVSGDLGAHPVGRFLDAPLAALDRERFDLYAYATINRDDAVTERLKETIPNWRRATHLSNDELTALIQGDKIDILFDMSGHSGGQRLRVFARKPAPIAVTWLGYFATTGVPAIDYVLANRWVIPEDEEDQWVETPWRLPDTYLCFSRPDVPVEVGPLPALANGYITFGSANNFSKLSEETVQCWARVLEAVPNSRLLLRTAVLNDPQRALEMRRRFEARGLPTDRLVMEPTVTDYAEHLSRYHAVDIALDPFPYAGGTTTVEALWMGVPVLTRHGDRYVSHMGENIMHNVGTPEWIAADTDDYVRRAADFAADLPRLSALRSGLRQRIETSPLMDAPAFARHLETALREMWRRWCANPT